jgi:hypothetical protein
MFHIIPAFLYKSVLSGLSHTLCIAILEIIFYILYITKLEKDMILDMVKNLGGKMNELCANKITNLDDIPKINSNIVALLNKQVKEMQNESDIKTNEMDNENEKYVKIGFRIIAIIFVIILVFAIIFAPNNHSHFKMWLGIGRDVIISLVFVGIFEYILVNYIIIKYNIIDMFSIELELLKSIVNSYRCYQVIN